MGILDNLKAQASNALGGPGAGPADTNSMVSSVVTMIDDPRIGGLPGLVQRFQTSGFDGIVSSWVGTGTNQPIAPDQITTALGTEHIDEIARSTGMTAGAVSSHIATLLPTIVDRLTPNGTLPESGTVTQGLATLQAFLQGNAGSSAQAESR